MWRKFTIISKPQWNVQESINDSQYREQDIKTTLVIWAFPLRWIYRGVSGQTKILQNKTKQKKKWQNLYRHWLCVCTGEEKNTMALRTLSCTGSLHKSKFTSIIFLQEHISHIRTGYAANEVAIHETMCLIHTIVRFWMFDCFSSWAIILNPTFFMYFIAFLYFIEAQNLNDVIIEICCPLW